MTNDNTPAPAWLCLDCQLTGGGASLCRAIDGSHTFELLARAYLSNENDHRHRAIDCVGEMVQSAPAAAVGFLIVACAQCTSVSDVCVIAAGPLEDLLEAHGPLVIPHLEKIAKIDPRFRLMLSGTWGVDRIDADVWNRLRSAVAPGPVVATDPRSPASGLTEKVATAAVLKALFSQAPPFDRHH